MTGHETLVGRYELRGLLGRGGMAEVYDGWDTRLCRPVAIKVLHPAYTTDTDLRRRFEVEARAAAALSHPNVVAIHDFGEHDGSPFIVMERLPGRTLHDVMTDVMTDRPLHPQQVRAILDDVLAGLGAAHAAGVLHRDIKPGNILVSADGSRMKVADFGIAKTGGAADTKTGQIIGTMCYMSPERVTGAPASVADDLYAVAVMGYEALLGHRAFPQDNPVALARAILDDPPPPLHLRRTDVDPALTTVVERGMARNPGHRFASAEQMRAALAGDPVALGSAPRVEPTPRPGTRVLAAPLAPTAGYPSAPPASRRRGGRRKPLLAAAAILTAFVVAAVALALDPFGSSPAPASVSTSTSVAPPTTSAAPPPPPPSSAPPPVLEPQPAPPPGPGPGGGPKPGRGHGNKKGPN
jgi:serine/threonine protein kinase